MARADAPDHGAAANHDSLAASPATHLPTAAIAGHSMTAVFVVELLFTAALCYVVLNVATSNNHLNN